LIYYKHKLNFPQVKTLVGAWVARLTLMVLLTIQSFFALGQIDSILSKKIDSLTFEDQKWRGLIRQLHNNEIDIISKEIVIRNLRLTDSLNFIEIKK
jgi:hypothetical protein